MHNMDTQKTKNEHFFLFFILPGFTFFKDFFGNLAAYNIKGMVLGVCHNDTDKGY